ncbi:hypothetical protein [Microbacterium sp. A93]
METFAHVLLISAGPLITALCITLNSKKINAQWRERRAARLATRA